MEGKKKSIFKRWWFWVALVIVIIGIMARQENSKEKINFTLNQDEQKDKKDGEKEKDVLYEIGEAFEVGNLGVKIIEVEEKKEFKSDNQFIKDITTDGKFIAITAELTNNDTKARTFSSTQFKIVDDNKREYATYTDTNLMMILGDKNIFLEECNPGMSRTGIFVFEVPEDIKSYSLKIDSGVGSAAKGSVTVKLK